MEHFTIQVNQVEEWQTLQDIPALDLLFTKARRTMVRGGTVSLVRLQPGSTPVTFETFHNGDDLEVYRNKVYRYLE